MTDTKWTWDLQRLASIAGVQLNELWDRDDDDEDPDVKIAGEDKRQKAFEKKNKGELKAAAKSEPPKKAAKPAAKAEEKKPEEKKPDPAPAKAEEKKEEPAKAAEEKKARGRAANPESFNQQAKAKAKSMSRGEFIRWAADLGKGKNYASTLFAKYNPKSSRQVAEAKEVWILTHPHMPTFTLAENYEMKTQQWVDSTSPFNTTLYMSEAEAQKAQKHLSEWRGQSSVIEKIVFESDQYLGSAGLSAWKAEAKKRGLEVKVTKTGELAAYDKDGHHVGSHLKDDSNPKNERWGYFD